MNFDVIKFMLGFANIPSADIDALQKNAPALARLADAARDLQPLMEEVVPLIQLAQPHIQALLPLFDSAKPHIEALKPLLDKALPLVQEALSTAQAEKGDLDSVLPMFIKFAKDLNAKS